MKFINRLEYGFFLLCYHMDKIVSFKNVKLTQNVIISKFTRNCLILKCRNDRLIALFVHIFEV